MTGGIARSMTDCTRHYSRYSGKSCLRFNAISGQHPWILVGFGHEWAIRRTETSRLPPAAGFKVIVPTLRRSVYRQSVVGAWVAIAHSKCVQSNVFSSWPHGHGIRQFRSQLNRSEPFDRGVRGSVRLHQVGAKSS